MIYIVILLVLIANPFKNTANASDPATLLAFTRVILEGVKEAIKADNERLLIPKIAELNRRVKNVDRVIQSTASAIISSIKDELSQTVRFELHIDSLFKLVSIIKSADEEYTEIIKECSLDNDSNCGFERHTIETFATSILSRSPNSVWSAMNQLHSVIEPDQTDRDLLQQQNIFTLFTDVLKVGEGSMCQKKQSPSEIINILFNYLQMIQLKGFTMIQFSWKLLTLYNKGNFTRESRVMQERYISRMVEQANSFSGAFELADSSYSRCDPAQHVEGKTYLQLTRLLQGYVVNEFNMVDMDKYVGNCRYTCSDYQNTILSVYDCVEDRFCSSQMQCNGELHDCQHTDSEITICHANPLTSKSRMYEWIRYSDGHELGHTERSCYKQSSVGRWGFFLFWLCNYCFCLCDDSTHSDRYFSLKDVLSSSNHNKVITGIKFVKENRIIHIQIQEGKLEQLGQIQQSSTTWQPVDDFTIKPGTEGLNYMKMSYDRRELDLDDLVAPAGHVITGVRFRMKELRLKLEIRASPFNFTTGTILGRKSFWLGNNISENQRTELLLESPDIPSKTIFPSVIDSESNQYLRFTHSDVTKDAAQTTVPFLDAQEVAPQPAVPLSGIGLYHKGQSGFGGFIGLRVNVFKRDVRSQINQEISNFSI